MTEEPKNEKAPTVSAICLIAVVFSLFAVAVHDKATEDARRAPRKTHTEWRDYFPTDFPKTVKYPLVTLNGAFQRAIGRRTVSNTKNLDIVRLSDGSIANGCSLVSPRRVAEAAEETAGLVIELAGRLRAVRGPSGTGIPLVFVLCPSKILPGDTRLPRGVPYVVNDAADAVLRKLDSAGVPRLDLREEYMSSGIPAQDFFFRTDHHWRPQSGLWAAAIVAGKLGETTGATIDLSVLDPGLYENGLSGKRSFLGSLGKRTGAWYAGLDDFSYPIPSFPTDLTSDTVSFRHGRVRTKHREGTFLEAFRDDRFEAGGVYVANPYSAILSGNRPFQRLVNRGRSEGLKILLLKDSFALCVAPYLSLACREVDLADGRHLRHLSFLDVAERERPDIVAIIVNAGATLAPQEIFNGVLEADCDSVVRREDVEAAVR